jgi:hypothetical protein
MILFVWLLVDVDVDVTISICFNVFRRKIILNFC